MRTIQRQDDAVAAALAVGLPPTSGVAAELMPGEDAAGGPPAICPELVMPSHEARFYIVRSSLDGVSKSGVHEIDLTGPSGRKLLSATVSNSDGCLSVMLAAVGMEDDPRCTVTSSASDGVSARRFDVLGRAGSAFGRIESGAPDRFDLVCHGATSVHFSRSKMAISVTTSAGRTLASAGIAGAGAGGDSDSNGSDGNRWELLVQPGSDAILTAACMLALILDPGEKE